MMMNTLVYVNSEHLFDFVKKLWYTIIVLKIQIIIYIFLYVLKINQNYLGRFIIPSVR